MCVDKGYFSRRIDECGKLTDDNATRIRIRFLIPVSSLEGFFFVLSPPAAHVMARATSRVAPTRTRAQVPCPAPAVATPRPPPRPLLLLLVLLVIMTVAVMHRRRRRDICVAPAAVVQVRVVRRLGARAFGPLVAVVVPVLDVRRRARTRRRSVCVRPAGRRPRWQR